MLRKYTLPLSSLTWSLLALLVVVASVAPVFSQDEPSEKPSEADALEAEEPEPSAPEPPAPSAPEPPAPSAPEPPAPSAPEPPAPSAPDLSAPSAQEPSAPSAQEPPALPAPAPVEAPKETAPAPKVQAAPKEARPFGPKGWDLSKRMFFPVEKNGAKILPQRFEYQLNETEVFRIGDALFDARVFRTLLEKEESSNRYKLNLTWPAAILFEGDVHIKDSAGKTLWSTAIISKSVDLRKTRTPEGYRSWLARTTFSGIPYSILERLQYYPFFQICVQRKDRETFISLCAKDLVLSIGKGQAVTIRDQTGLREKSVVEINGKEVDTQGAIFLNNESDLIFLRAVYKSGASIEIQTSLKQVQFIDLISTDKPGKLNLRGQGAIPADPRGVRRIGLTTWESVLDEKKPVIFLRGEGGIPLKQEFLIAGSGRPKDLRIDVLGLYPSAKEDYNRGFAGAEEWTFQLKSNQPHRLEGVGKESLIEYRNEEILWTVSDLTRDEKNTRFVRIKAPGQDVIAAFDVFRKRTREVSIKGTFPLGLLSSARIDPLHAWYSAWVSANNPLSKAKPSDMFIHRWSLGASVHPQFISEDYLIPPWQLGFQYNYHTTEFQDLSALSGLLMTSFYLPRSLSLIGYSGTLKIDYSLAGGTAPFILKPGLMIDLEFRPEGPQGWSYGIFSHQYNFEPNRATGSIQRTGIMAGYYQAF